MPTRQQAWELLTRYTKSKNLLKHALAVEAAMRYYARHFGDNEETWGIVGLLHDFDYEIHPTLDKHPAEGQKILSEAGYSEEIRQGIMAHAPHTGTPRLTRLHHAIFAVDELTGLIVACALVRPDKKLASVDIESVTKKMKQKSFAAGVNRQDITQGAEELGLTVDEHIQNVLAAMQGVADQLEL